MSIKIGDRLKFKKFDWVIVDERRATAGFKYYRYRVERKYFFGNSIPLKYTDQSYNIFADRWLFLKKQLKKNPNYHYTMHLWSNRERT